jgi:hypothetical protein
MLYWQGLNLTYRTGFVQQDFGVIAQDKLVHDRGEGKGTLSQKIKN